MNAKTHEAIEKHGRNLLAIFPNATERNPVALCKKIRRIETAVSRLSEDYCNGLIEMDAWTNGKARALNRVRKLLYPNEYRTEVQVNGDPRGYALKICDEWMRENSFNLHRDMGGYGILAPDLTV